MKFYLFYCNFFFPEGIEGINRWNEDEFTKEKAKAIDNHWQSKISTDGFDPSNSDDKFYILSMFPYPSGNLHMGHVRVYTIGDALARYFRMRGKNVIHPMGWDAFGLPAENAAIEKGVDPEEWTQKNIAQMKSVMEKLNLTFDWDREFATCDSDYYKWTQFFFLKMYERGLVYRKEGIINWDPVDQTVLADEQVSSSGRSWRSGAVVEKKLLNQWFIRITEFGSQLYEGLNNINLSGWRDVVEIQKNWLGKPTGTTIDFEIIDGVSNQSSIKIPIWISHPEYIDRAKFVAIKPNSFWTFGNNIVGLLPYRLRNPFTNEDLPVYVTAEMEYQEGADVYLGIPDLSERVKEFAKSLKIPDSPSLQEIARKDELISLREKICSEARERRIGGYLTSPKMKDWLISRQRYWGTPIPIIHCEKCGEQPIPENELPVKLPKVKSVKIGENPLKENKDWFNVNCPKCGGPATRETDTMDTFVDSSWYYLRFLDPDNEDAAFNVEKVKKIMPVDVYIGGKEHSSLHLYYTRFFNYFLHSLDLVPEREPFRQLLCQGMVRGLTYRTENQGKLVKPELVIQKDNKLFHKETNQLLFSSWEKMSKSKFNGVEPEVLLQEYGVDTTRLMILAEAAPWYNLNWDEKSFVNVLKWQHRLWITLCDFIRLRSLNRQKVEETEEFKKLDYYLFDSKNYYIEKISNLMQNFNIHSAISKMQGLTKSMRKVNENVVVFSPNYEKALATQIIMLTPLTPNFASELWSGFLKAPNRLSTSEEIRWDLPVIKQKWPSVDPDYSFRANEIESMLNLGNPYKTKEQRNREKLQKLKDKKKKTFTIGINDDNNEVGSIVKGTTVKEDEMR